MKLYVFTSGTLTCDKNFITFGRDAGKRLTIPVPYFLIDHPKGKILFDTGNAREVATDSHDPHKHWGTMADIYVPDMKEEEYVVEGLKKVNVDPSEIKYVIMSHLHLDHAGGIGEFPNAKYIVQKDELRWAYTPQFYQAATYIRHDFDKPVDWFMMYGYETDNFDVFNDGSVIIWFTPGHTPGHQSLVLRLKSDTYVLTGDSCYTSEILNENVLPGLGWNSELTVRSIQKLRWARDFLGYKIITGHDPESFRTLKKAPQYYE